MDEDNIKPHGTASKMTARLEYAARGWTSFPIKPGTKKPCKAGMHSNGARWGASKHPAVIRRDHRRWPDANIGIPTGPENDFYVVEADTKAGHDIDGIASLRALEAEHGPLPETLMVQSPSGSLHYYFKYPDGVTIINSASKVAPGVDVRGDGGMVLAPPSIKPGVGIYKWLNDLPIADAPVWLLKLLNEKSKKPEKPAKQGRSISEQAVATIRRPSNHNTNSKYAEAALRGECETVASSAIGCRNAQLNKSAFNLGTLVGACELTESKVFDALFAAAVTNGLAGDDGKAACIATIRSGLNAGIKQPRTIPEPRSFYRHDVDWLRAIITRRRVHAQ